MSTTLSVILLFWCSARQAEAKSPENSSSAVLLSYNRQAYAVYEAWRGSGTFSLLFISNRSEAFLAYQDDGTYKNLDLSLVNGNLRLRVTLGGCVQEQLTVQGNFSDSQWHQVRLIREYVKITLKLDGCVSESLHCGHISSADDWKVLYVGGIPLNLQLNSLANPSIYYFESGFQGCIAQVAYNLSGEGLKPLLLRSSSGTGTKCPFQCPAKGKRCFNSFEPITEKCGCLGTKSSDCLIELLPVGTVFSHSVQKSSIIHSSVDFSTEFTSKVSLMMPSFPINVPVRASVVLNTTVHPALPNSTFSSALIKNQWQSKEKATRAATPGLLNSPSRNPIHLTRTLSLWLSSVTTSPSRSSLSNSFGGSLESDITAQAKKSGGTAFHVTGCPFFLYIPFAAAVFNSFLSHLE